MLMSTCSVNSCTNINAAVQGQLNYGTYGKYYWLYFNPKNILNLPQ